jgi:hypothetical protein
MPNIQKTTDCRSDRQPVRFRGRSILLLHRSEIGMHTLRRHRSECWLIRAWLVERRAIRMLPLCLDRLLCLFAQGGDLVKLLNRRLVALQSRLNDLNGSLLTLSQFFKTLRVLLLLLQQLLVVLSRLLGLLHKLLHQALALLKRLVCRLVRLVRLVPLVRELHGNYLLFVLNNVY